MSPPKLSLPSNWNRTRSQTALLSAMPADPEARAPYIQQMLASQPFIMLSHLTSAQIAESGIPPEVLLEQRRRESALYSGTDSGTESDEEHDESSAKILPTSPIIPNTSAAVDQPTPPSANVTPDANADVIPEPAAGAATVAPPPAKRRLRCTAPRGHVSPVKPPSPVKEPVLPRKIRAGCVSLRTADAPIPAGAPVVRKSE